MTDWFDPQKWVSRVTDALDTDPWTPGSWDQLLPTELIPTSPLADLASLAIGRRVTIGSIEGTVSAFELAPWWSPQLHAPIPGEMLERVTLELVDARWSNRAIDRLAIVAESVRYGLRGGPSLKASPVSIRATAPLSMLGRWVEQQTRNLEFETDPVIDPTDSTFVELVFRYRRVPFRARLQPRVTSHSAVVVVRELTCLGRRMPLPRRFPMAIDIPIELDPGTSFVSVGLVGDDALMLGLELEDVEWAIDIGKLTERFRGGTGVIDAGRLVARSGPRPAEE